MMHMTYKLLSVVMLLALNTQNSASVTISNSKHYTVATVKNEDGEPFATLSYGQSITIPTEKTFVVQSKNITPKKSPVDQHGYRLPQQTSPNGIGRTMLERSGYRIPNTMER